MLSNNNQWFAVLVVLVVSLPVVADDDCEAVVDMADSLDFHKMHVECSEDPVTIYDAKSKGSFLSKKKTAVTTYEKAGEGTANTTATVQAQDNTAAPTKLDEEASYPAGADNAGVVFNIREPFSVSAGPHPAINGLYVQMAAYCPQGWKKLEEWVAPAETGYFLHYQFQCAQ